MRNADEAADVVWAFKAPVEVEHVASSGNAGWTLVADRSRNIHVLDESGTSKGAFRAGQPVRRVRADPDGVVFSALAGDTIIYAFNRQGELEWRVEMGGPVVDFDLDASVRRLAAVSTAGWLYLYSPDSRERRVAPVGWPMNWVALVGGEPTQIAVCNDKGHVGLLAFDGKLQWQKDLGCRAGGLCASAGAQLLVVAGSDAGIVLLRLDGEEVDKIGLSDPVVRCAVSPNGALLLAQTAQHKLVLLRPDASVLWERQLGGAPADWAMGAAGATVVVAQGGRDVTAYATGQGSRPRARPAPAKEAVPAVASAPKAQAQAPSAEEAPQVDDIEWPESFEIESPVAKPGAKAGQKASTAQRTAAPSGKPSVPSTARTAQPGPVAGAAPALTQPTHQVTWKVKLPPAALPVEGSLFRSSADAGYAVLVTANGVAMALSAEGRQVVRAELDKAAHIAPRQPGGRTAVWTESSVLILDPAAGSVSTLSLPGGPVSALDCSRDLALFCAVDAAGSLSAYGADGALLWQKEAKGAPAGVLVSPGGETILVPDAEGRFRYYGRDGALLRKFRFAEGEHRALALGDAFSVSADAHGRLAVMDPDGREMWSRTLFPKVTGAEVLDGNIAVYGENGACAAVDPRQDAVWEFQPPPGRARIRRPAGADPVAVHVAGSAITVFRGYRRKLDVIWHYDCRADVGAFDADANAKAVTAIAGDKVYRIEGVGPA